MPGFYLSAARLASVSGKSGMKAYGKGKVFHINGVNNVTLANVSEGLPVSNFRPLQSWPARAHPQQERIDAFLSLGRK
jgi:hypothetical protein